MASNPFGKLGLQDAEEALKSIGVDAFFRSASERLDGGHVVVDSRRLIMAGSNDYLGLSHHPEVIEAAVAAVRRYGTSVSGSRPLNGTLDLHERLEARLAGFLGQPSAMVVTTGYQANLALSALLGPNDVAFSDARNHASLIEATRLGAGSVRVYRHGDVDHLAELLAQAPAGTGRLIITDGVFSMEGDAAPLRALRQLADEHGARLIVDSAHDLGMLGRRGAGLSELCGLEERTDLITATFSKALGSIGGALAGPAENVRYLRYNARSATFSAALPPASAAAALTALDIIESQPERRERLFRLAEGLHNGARRLGFDTSPSTTPIVPLWFPDIPAAGAYWTALFEEGVFTNLVGPPAVAPGRAMLRMTLTAGHDDGDLDAVLAAMARATRKLGSPGRPLPPITLTRV